MYRLTPSVRRALREAEEQFQHKETKECQELTIQNQFLRTVLNSLSHPFYVLDIKDYTIILANPAANKGDLDTPSYCYALTHRRSKPCEGEHPCPLNIVKKTKQAVVVEHIHYDIEGNVREVEVHAHPVFDKDGTLIQMIEYSLDIADRKRSELELARFRAVMDQAKDAILITNARTGQIIDVNETTCQLLGYSREELLKLSAKHAEVGYLEAPELWDHYANLAKSKGTIFLPQGLQRCKEGRQFPVEVSISYEQFENQDYILIVFRDITERKQAEEAIRKINKELIAANEEIKTTQAQLIQSAKLASLGEMATGIAHELNQPLQIISLKAERELKSIKKGSKETKQTFEKILAQIKRASLIVNHLRTFGRETLLLQIKAEDINQIIEDSFLLLNEQLKLHGIEVKRELADKLPLVSCQAIQIEQVLTNLITNARDAMESEMPNRSEPKQITVRSRQQANWIIMEMEDTGEGIPDEIQKKIFDPFFTTKEIGKGTGLGLSISYGIIKTHGGRIEVESKVGQGTLFRIFLPVK
ncbi:ATP-binding protein [Deltaproteobacteria bacterium TL4]